MKKLLIFLLNINILYCAELARATEFYPNSKVIEKVRHNVHATDYEHILYLEDALKYIQFDYLKASLEDYRIEYEMSNCFCCINQKRLKELYDFETKFLRFLYEAQKRRNNHIKLAKESILKDDAQTFDAELKHISDFRDNRELSNFALINLAENCLMVLDLDRVRELRRNAVVEAEITDDNCHRITAVFSILGLDENGLKDTDFNKYNFITMALEICNHRLVIELLKLYPNLAFIEDARGISPIMMMKSNRSENIIAELQVAGILTEVDVVEHLRRSESQLKRLRVIQREEVIQRRHQVISEILSRPTRTISMQAFSADE